MAVYFAYGSNMNTVQMAKERCPGSRPLGLAVLRGWEFRINGRGVATVVERPGANCWGVLWECTDEHIVTLDQCEGVARGIYERRTMRVEKEDGGTLEAIVYVEDREDLAPPRMGYLEKILAGAREHGLPEDRIAELEEWGCEHPHARWRQD